MKRNKIFRSRHIKVEVRLPDDFKHLDIEDDWDREEMVKILRKEWVQLASEIEQALYVKRESKTPSLRDMFP